MACYNKMERTFLQGLLWMYLLGFGFMALSLEPGFLDFDNLPDTNFTCVGKVIGGYYADLETNCQMFHVCTIGQLDEPMDIRFLCLNGTVFDQETRVCERIDEVDCTKSEQFYSLNLELYGNSQLSNLEENPETEQPLIIKSTPPSSTTPTEAPPHPAPYDGGRQQQRLPSHHFPVVDANTSPDIRFNPEEINVSLNADAPPNFRANPHHHGAEPRGGGGASTQRGYRGGEFGGYERVTPREVNFGFELEGGKEEEGEEEDGEEGEEYGTEETQRDNYHLQTQYKPSQQYAAPQHDSSSHHFPSSTYRSSDFSSSTTTAKVSNFHQHNPAKSTIATSTSTTVRSPHISGGSPQRLQLPLPPQLPTLTFSTPAPFSLQRRVEQKRYTKDHLPPPRIVISASASVSDASGRRLNYSLGTIDTSPLMRRPPTTYDEYKDDDVILDPFYLDVQKLRSRRRRRRRRSAEEDKPGRYDIIKNDEDAVRVLKFLFDWYRNEKTDPSRLTTPLTTQSITAINDELSPKEEVDNDSIGFELKASDVFDKRSKYSLVDVSGVTRGHEEVKKVNNVQKHITFKDDGDELFGHEEDYINDNYEPAAYDHKYGEFGFGYNEDKDFDKERLHEFPRLDEEAKNFSLADDYVDDNIEPIYYRDHIDEHEDYPENDTNQLERFGSKESTTDISQLLSSTVEASEEPETTADSTEYSASTSTMSAETAQATEKSTTTTSRSRSNRRRGRRRNITESRDKDEHKTHNEKLIEKPYRAKDDYDYLRTVHVHTSSPKVIASDSKTLVDTTEESYQTTGNMVEVTESPVNSTRISPVSSTEVSDSDHVVSNEDILITTSSTTESFRSSKRRRGKQKYQDETNQKKSHRRRKPPKPPEASFEDAIPVGGSDNISSAIENASSNAGLISEVSTAENNQSSIDSSIVEVVEATTKSHLVKSRRGRMKFLSIPADDVSDSVQSTRAPSATSRQEEVLGTPNLTSTEPSYNSNDSVANESFPQATSTTIVENNTYAYSKLLEEVYATAFVPTTDSVHITKKKQLKENLLNSEFPTTESSLELNTRRGTDTTEDYTQSTGTMLGDIWTTDGLFTIDEDIGLSTIKSSLESDSFVTEGKEVFQTTLPPTTLETTTNVNKDHILSRGMRLVSVVVEGMPTKAVTTETDTTTVRDGDELGTETFPLTEPSYQFSYGKQPYTEKITTEGMPTKSDPIATDTTTVRDGDEFVTETFSVTEPSYQFSYGKQSYTEKITTEGYLARINTSIANTEPTVDSTEPHVASANSPFDWTDPPVVPTEAPVTQTKPPVTTTQSTANPTKPPAAHKKQPVATTDSPVATTDSPVAITDSPVARTKAPVATTDSDVATTDSHVATTKLPVAATKLPVAATKLPVATTEPPVAVTEPPVATTEPHVALTDSPVAPTEPPLPTSRPQRRRGGGHRFRGRQFAARGPPTEYPVGESANPTQAQRALGTTPLSRVAVTGPKRFFNCFGKEVDKFYPDSRDCRLFHYCTSGYNENQLLDMRFVCDFNTFFDEEKVICTKAKPRRCL